MPASNSPACRYRGAPFPAITPPDERNNHPLTEPLRQRFIDTVDADWWAEDLANWRFIGLNAQLIDSGLPNEPEQWAFLEAALADAGDRRLAIWLHKPLFVRDPDSTGRMLTALFPQGRRRVMALCEQHSVALVGSGHLHRYRRQRIGETRLIWAPATSFLMGARKGLPGVARLGYMRYRFSRSSFTAQFVEPPLFVNLDVRNWNKFRGSTIHLPERGLRSPVHSSPNSRNSSANSGGRASVSVSARSGGASSGLK